LAEQASSEAGDAAPEPTPPEGGNGNAANFAQADLEELANEPVAPDSEANLESILDIPVTLSMELGRTKICIRNLLQLSQGSVVELDRLAGEPLDVMVNGTLVAHGEVVVVNEKFGIRVTDVISAQERVKKLT
jgi:flagellar motor switch protein FliN